VSVIYLGIDLHFDLWWRIFYLSLNKDDGGSMQRIGAAAIQLCDNMKSRYLELSFPSSEKEWHKKWFYLYDPTGSLPAYLADHLGAVALPSWKGGPTDERLKLVERLLERITFVKNAGLMGQAVVRTSLLRCVLSLKVRAFPKWDYIRSPIQGVIPVPPSPGGV
jgi:hypothetical protein